DDPSRHVVGVARLLQVELLVGEQRREIFEARPRLGLVGIEAVDRVDLEHRRVLLVATRRAAEAGDVIALAQSELPCELHRDVGVVATGQIAVDAEEAVALFAQVEVTGDADGLQSDLRTVVVIGAVRAWFEALLFTARSSVAAALVAAPAATPAVAALAVAVVALAIVGVVVVVVTRLPGRTGGARRRGRHGEFGDRDLARLDEFDLPVGQRFAVRAEDIRS